jgi:hypothetical protein
VIQKKAGRAQRDIIYIVLLAGIFNLSLKKFLFLVLQPAKVTRSILAFIYTDIKPRLDQMIRLDNLIVFSNYDPFTCKRKFFSKNLN